MTAVRLYGNGSPNVVKVMIACEELGIPWVLEPVDVIKGDQYHADFRALNPNGRVPVIVDGALGDPAITVFDSSAILIHLALTRNVLIPQDLAGRARVLQWTMFVASGLGPMSGQFTHFLRHGAAAGSYALERYRAEVSRLARVLDGKLEGGAFIDGAFSIADISVYPWIHVALDLIGPETNFPALAAWRRRIAERPAVMRANAHAAAIRDVDMASFATATPAQLDRFFNRAASSAAVTA